MKVTIRTKPIQGRLYGVNTMNPPVNGLSHSLNQRMVKLSGGASSTLSNYIDNVAGSDFISDKRRMLVVENIR